MLPGFLPSAWTAMWLLPAAALIGMWVAWSDMKFMKIPNKAVLAMAGAYLVLGPVALPLDHYLWGWVLGGIVLVIGFLASTAGLIGAGDAKFAAAMAPFFVGGDARFIFALFAACLLGAFAAHRGLGMVPQFRSATADWKSWQVRDFPMGLALAGTVNFYFVVALLISA
jgi:prepilin peptidase CpaA